MASASTSKIREFTRLALTSVPPAVKFKLKHMTAEGGAQLLLDMRVRGDDANQIADAISKQAVDAAVTVTESFGGMPQRFVLVALSKESPDSKLRAVGSYPWVEKSKQSSIQRSMAGMGLGSEPSEPATQAGLLAQLMRHNESHARILADTVGAIIERQQETIESQRKQIENESSNRLRIVELVEELKSDKMTRDLAFDEHSRDQERKDAMMKKLMEIGFPVVAHHMSQFFGAKLSEKAGAISKLQKLGASLTPEQGEALQKLLTPEQALLLTDALTGDDESAEPKH